MRKINAIIVDDERPARKELIFLLKNTPEIVVLGEADNISDAITLIVTKKPDLVFLDIQLSGENGFDLLQKVAVNFKVIFVTAFDEYAIRAFEVNATDYLLKPVDPARLELSLKRIFDNAEHKQPQQKKFEYNDTIYVKLNNCTAKFLEISSISTITSVGNYSKLEVLDGSNYVILKTLKQWEAELPSASFIRIHRSTIVNKRHIVRIENYSKSHHKVFMKSKDKPLEISRNCFVNLKIVNN